jgi:16S rRNA (uracil1498-N3)-methyltransferase
MSRVLRLQAGDDVLVLDGTGAEYRVRLLDDGAGTLTGEIVSRGRSRSEPGLHLTLYAALLKGSKFEVVLQKCTEIGVSHFIPVLSERTVPSAPTHDRLERYRTIVREAAEQSGRGRLPELSNAIPLTEAIASSTARGATVVLWEGEGERGLNDLSAPSPGARLSLFVGPEGGFSDAEAEQATALGAAIISIGPRILRAETASIVGSALLLDRAGEMSPRRAIDTRFG